MRPGSGIGASGGGGTDDVGSQTRPRSRGRWRRRVGEHTGAGRQAGGGAGSGGSRGPVGKPVDEQEFERLRAWRMQCAEGKPAFTVAADTVLEEILRRRHREG